MKEITEGTQGEAAVILEDGIPIPITEIKSRLMELQKLKEFMKETGIEGYLKVVKVGSGNTTKYKIDSCEIEVIKTK
jgi:hypothetical protein